MQGYIRSAKVGKQGRDDNIKQFRIQLHPTHFSTLKFFTLVQS